MKTSTKESTKVITLDGPAGTGKGTISQLLARELGWHYLDSGALYRVLAFAALQNSINLADEDALSTLAGDINLRFENDADGLHIWLADKNITSAIRSEPVGEAASKIATSPKVRNALSAKQKSFRQSPGLVTDGRDMGTVIFPDAVLKFFLDASNEERAKRRYLQLKNAGVDVNLGAILKDLEQRDVRDRTRSVSPLKPASDAILIDTTALTIEAVFEEVMEHVQKTGITPLKSNI